MKRAGLILILLCSAIIAIDIVEAHEFTPIPDQLYEQEMYENLQRQISDLHRELTPPPVQQYGIQPVPQMQPHVTPLPRYDWQSTPGPETEWETLDGFGCVERRIDPDGIVEYRECEK